MMPVFPVVTIAPGAPGALITAYYQYEFQGWLFGSGTSYKTETVEGILSLPTARSQDDEDQEDHGSHAGVDLLPGRTITVAMNVLIEGAPVQSLLDVVMSACRVSKRAAFIEYPLVTYRPGHSARYFNARVRRCEFPSNYETAHGKAVGALQWFCTDPRCYTALETQVDLVTANGGASINGNVQMLGNFLDGTSPIIEISGPCTNPRIQNNGDGGRTIRIDVVVPVGQTLVIDAKAKTVFLNGVDSYDTVRADNEWWVLLPGPNDVVYNRSGAGAPSNCKVRWHDAWNGA